ncbi:MAG: hypothetical protein HGA45_18365 [Chloroflexales bacterium]|nr:hypothetical protein [Chloroflexales bacterium]
MKRILMGMLSGALAVAGVVGLSQTSPSVAAAMQSVQTTSAQQRGPGMNDSTHAGGQVASVDGTTITVTGRDGASQAIQTTGSTTVELDGSTSSLSAIAAGQFIHAEGTTNSAGVFTATAVHASTTAPQGRPGDGGPGRNDGTYAGGQVASVDGTTITVTGRDGTSQAIQTTGSTTVELDGSASNLSAIAAGQFIHAEGTTDSAGTFTATVVHANTTAPQGRPRGPGRNDGTRAGGQVASVDGSTITVTRPDGTSQAILTTDSTTVELDGSTTSRDKLAAGQFIHAEGTTDSTGTFTATAVHASTTAPQGRPGDGGPGRNDGTHAGGQVASVDGSTITVTRPDGTSQTIQTTGSTTVELDGSASSLSAIAAGQFIHAEGTTDSAGAFTATAVHASTTAPQGRPGGPRP